MSFFKKKQREIKQKIKNDNFDAMDDLDFDDFDFDDIDDPLITSKKRSPVMRVGKGILKGIKSHAFDFRNHRREILKHFPDLVTETIEQIEETKDSLADEIRKTAKDVRPDLRSISSSIDKMVPSKYARTKRATSKIVEKLSDTEYETVSPERAREETLSNTLSDIFTATQASDDYRQKRLEAQAGISEKLAEGRHKQTSFQLGKIHESVSLANAFNTKVTTAFQKKLLEIQFRSYYVQSDLLSSYKTQSQEMKLILAGIMKNTALPDYAKMNESDRFKATARKELFNTAKEKFFSRNGYYKRIVEESKNKLSEFKLDMVSDALRDFLQGQEVGMDLIEDGVAAIVSQGILPGITSKYIKKAMEKYVPKGGDRHNRILNAVIKMQNPAKRGEELADTIEDWQYDPSLLKSLLGKAGSPIADILRRASGAKEPTINLRKTDEELLAGAEFNKISQISLVKIIPGYLSRILQQSERIGNIESLMYKRLEPANDPKVGERLKGAIPELLKYNSSTGEFLSESSMDKWIAKRIDKERDLEGRATRLAELSRMALEGKDFITAKSNMRDTVNQQYKKIISDLGLARQALKGIKESDIRESYKKQIESIRTRLNDFKKTYMNSQVSNYSFPYQEFIDLARDINYLIQEIHTTLGSQSTLTQLASQSEGRVSNFEKLTSDIEKKDLNITSDQVQALTKIFHVADVENIGLEELPTALKQKSFIDKLEIKYGISSDTVKKIRSILNNTDFKNNKEVLANLVSEHTRYREANQSGLGILARQRELGNVSTSAFHRFGVSMDANKTYAKVNQASVMRGIIGKGEKVMKESNLHFWQNQLMPNIASQETKRKFNLLLNELGAGDKTRLLEYLHDSGSGDISKVENMINNMIVRYKDYNNKDKTGDLFDHLTTESEIQPSNGQYSSDEALKNIKGKVNFGNNKGYSPNGMPTAQRVASMKNNLVYSYKGDPTKAKYVGPTAQDVQDKFGDAVAPGGKKINIGSMFGTLGTSIGEIYKTVENQQYGYTQAIAYQTGQNASYQVAELAAKGIPASFINKIFGKKAQSVEEITQLIEKGYKAGADAKATVEEKLSAARDKIKEKRTGFRQAMVDKYGDWGTYLKSKKGEIKDNVTAKVHEANGRLRGFATSVSNNETLKGTILDKAATRLAEDMDEIVNSPDGETRAKALSDMFISLISNGVEKIGQGGRFAYAKTVGKFVSKSVKVYNKYKSVNCMSSVYLGKHDLQNPVLDSVNYRTTNISEQYFDVKTKRRITSACHVRGAVCHANGSIVVSDEQIKEHGLYVLDNDGNPVKLGGIKFMAATGMNAAARLAKFAINKIWNNKATKKIRDIAVKRSKWLVDSKLGKKVRGSFLGRRTGDIRDILHATHRTLLGDNQLLPTLTDKLENMRNYHFKKPGTGHLGKYGAMLGDALTGSFNDEPDYYEPASIVRRKHENDMIKAQRHWENITSKINDPLKAEKHLQKYQRSIDSLNKKKIPEEEKKRLAHLLHITYFGHENPNVGPVDYKKLAYENATGKTKQKVLDRHHPFKSMFRVGGMALRHPIRAGLIGAAGLAMAPAIVPAAGIAGAGYLGYKAVKHDVSGGGIGRRWARWKKPWTIPGAIAGSVMHPFTHPGNGDNYASVYGPPKPDNLYNPNRLPFDDTVINGDEKVRKGGIRYLMNKMKSKKKTPHEKIVDIMKDHKAASGGLLGMGLLGVIGDVLGKSFHVLKGVWDTLKFIKDASKMLFKLPKLFMSLGSFLKRGFGKLGNLFRGKAGTVAEDGTETGAEDVTETGAEEAVGTGAAVEGGAVAEGGAASVGLLGSLGLGAVAAGVGAGIGWGINKYVLNKYVPGWKSGKDVYDFFNGSQKQRMMQQNLKDGITSFKMAISLMKKHPDMKVDVLLKTKVYNTLVHGTLFQYAVKHSRSSLCGQFLKIRSEFLSEADKLIHTDTLHAKKVLTSANNGKKAKGTKDTLDDASIMFNKPKRTQTLSMKYVDKRDKYDKGMDKDLSTWTALFKKYVPIFKESPEEGLKFFISVPTQKALYGPLYEFAKKNASSLSLSYLDARIDFLKAGSATSSKNKLKLKKDSALAMTGAAKAKKNKQTGMLTNIWNDVFGPRHPNSALSTVQNVSRAKTWGAPGSNPLGMSFKGNTPQVNLTLAKNARKSKQKIISEIKSVSDKHGFDSGYLMYTAAMESGFNPSAQNPYGSASGLYQYIDSTWSSKIRQYAGQYKIPYNANPFDIKYSTIIAGASANHDASYLSSLKPTVYYIDLYMIHFLGQGGATTFFKYLKESPKTSAAGLFGYQAAQDNPSYFYENGSTLSVKGMYEKIASLMTYASKSFGLSSQSFDVYGEHGKVGHLKKTIANKTKTKAKEAIHKGLGKPNKAAPATPAATGKAMTVVNSKPKVPTTTAVAKKHVSTPNLVNTGDAHQAFVKKHRNANPRVETATVTNNHLSDIAEHNKEMKFILKQQLTVQTQTLGYLKTIAQSINKNAANKNVSANAPMPKITAEPIVKPHTPTPAVHVGARAAALRAANSVLD